MIRHTLDAQLGGAMTTLMAALPGAAVFWLATRPIRDGSRGLRAFLIAGASYAAMLVAAGVVAFLMERPAQVGDALMGAVMGGVVVARILPQPEAT
ncbi:hypothetical protein KPL78_09100 [Roseomonas sp. HJA6]|uniref:Uncharacterized protein n=1 Tax=Roseomonas alba TaxID=2846776 RepID=A0ABS7A6W8_9PROT|nr:hypothetical protein [Neoroseomonas alba]MBW6398001.1 hypothetical protein [Neoroseomonas alba]